MSDKLLYSKKPEAGEAYDVAIIGSGPAGLTAAIYTTRGAASTLVLAGNNWGGQLMLTTTVDNFPGFENGVEGSDLMKKIRAQTERFGADIINENVTEVDFSIKPFKIKTDKDVFTSKSLIVATGSDTKWLGIPGEERLRGKGVSSCAPCDAPFFKGKDVAVIGGGDSAMEEALVLTKYAKSVVIIHRRDKFKASKAMQKRIFDNKNIKIKWNSEVKEFIGQDRLEKIKIFNLENNCEEEINISGVFVAIGHSPSTKIFEGKLDLDEKGYLQPRLVNEKLSNLPKYSSASNVEGVFIAGDVHDFTYKQAVTAAGFGCMAGMDALKYLEKDLPTW